MARTVVTDVFNPEILGETVRGVFAQKDAFMGSLLAAQGAVIINDSFEESNPRRIGTTVTIPYFGTLGSFVNNPDGSAVDFAALGTSEENATVARDSLGFEVSNWAQHGGPRDVDPYEESSRQILVAAVRAMDKAIIDQAATTPLVQDVYDTDTPTTMSYDLMVDGKTTFWGDDQDDVVAAIVHSRTKADLLKLKDSNGNPLLVDRQNTGDFDRFCGIPLVMSDKAPLTGSTMSSVTSAGSTPPTVTLSGTPTGPWDLTIEIVTGGSSDGTATFRFKVKGNIWSATYTVPSGGGAIELKDDGSIADANGNKTVDSIVGVNGKTGITATFANGTYNADNSYTAKAQMKVATHLVKRGALAFWYNRQALGLKTDSDIARDTNLGAMHLYRAAHLYRRRPMGTMPGVVSIQHNVAGY